MSAGKAEYIAAIYALHAVLVCVRLTEVEVDRVR
jgi:hypothetical protein